MHFIGSGSFQVQASLSNADSGLGGSLVTATITVGAVPHTPSVTDAVTDEDVQSTSGLVISRNAIDGNEVTHFKITAIANGTLFQNDGTTQIHDGDFITVADGNAGLKFTPAADFFGNGSFQVQASLSNDDSGLGGGLATATITVNPVADTPTVTSATTDEDTQSSSGLVIERNAADGSEVAFFKITDISDGILYLDDGTTVIQDGDFIPADASAGLKFTPSADFFGMATFKVQASLTNSDSGLGGELATATITVNPVADTPSVTDATTKEDSQTTSGLVIARNDVDGAEVTHFKITAIANGILFQNDGTTPIGDGEFITFAEANAGLRFTPAANFFGTATFQVQASLSNSDSGLGGNVVTATILVNPVADTPTVTDTGTNEDTQSTTGLVISRNAADSSEVTHFKITGITDGTLYQNDGITPISDGSFITVADGNAGLKFTPHADFNGSANFQVQSSLTDDDSGLGGGLATATITVDAVNDEPINSLPSSFSTIEDTAVVLNGISASDIDAGLANVQVTLSVPSGTGALVIRSDVFGGVDAGQIAGNGSDSVAVTAPLAAINATLADPNGLTYQPAADLFGTVGLTMLTDDRGNTGLGGALTDTDTSTISITPIADTPSVTNASTNEDEQSTAGLVISRNSADGSEVGFFQINAIQHGTLYLNDGSTPIHDGDFIAAADGLAGLKFTPDADYFGQGRFDVRAATSNDVAGLGGSTITSTIDISPVADTPSVTNASTNEDAQSTSGLVLSRNPVDGAEVSHFRITNITNGSLFLNDGVTPIQNGDFIAIADGALGLKFTPSADFFGTATFDVQASIGADPSGLGGSTVTASIAVNAVADQPSASNASTNEDTQTAGGPVITPNVVDGTSVTHFQITAIANGTLYQSDGQTPIHDGDFITVADGAAGLKFQPAADYFGTGSFQVQAATAASIAGLGGTPITATITVNSVNDAPTLDAIGDLSIDEDATEQTVNLTGISVGPANEVIAGQSIVSVSATSDDHSLLADPVVDFDAGSGSYQLRLTPIANANGVVHIAVTVQDDGGTDLGGIDSTTKSFNVTLGPIPDAPILDSFFIPMLPAVTLRNISSGTPMSHLVENVTDYDSADPRGIAIVGLENMAGKRTIGTWQFSTDGGMSWTDVPSDVLPTNAFLIGDSPATRIRFLPTKAFNGFVSISYRAWDQSQGSQFDRADTTVANTTFSTSIERAWVGVGHAKPKIDANGNTILPSVREDARHPRVVKVATVLGLAAKEQSTSKGLGIALVSASTTDGKWQYRLAHTPDWVNLGTVNNNSALLLRPNDFLRFVANPNADGEATIVFKTWDAKTGTAGSQVDPVGTAFSVDGGSAILDIIPVNDAPVLTPPAIPPTLNPITVNQTSDVISLATILNATDVEGANIGVAIIGAKGNGTWEYSTDGGVTWQTLKASSSKRLYLDADTLVRFTASASTRKSTAKLSFKAWDRSVNSHSKPIASSVSRITEVLSVAVN